MRYRDHTHIRGRIADTSEQSNAQRKAALKAFKAEIEAMRTGAIQLAEENAARTSAGYRFPVHGETPQLTI